MFAQKGFSVGDPETAGARLGQTFTSCLGSRVTRNAGFNILGVILPTIVGIAAVPILLQNLGESRLGIFTLALGLIGFASIFDLGLGRALTQTVATAAGGNASAEAIANVVRRALLIVLALGAIWGSVLWLAAGPISNDVFRLEEPVSHEAMQGIRWLAIAVPALLLTSGMAGALEGLQQFGLVNLIRAPLNVLTFVVPALTSVWFQDVGLVIAGIAFVRLASLIPWLWAVARAIPLFSHGGKSSLDQSTMWRFTGWLTVSNIVGPLMVHADRFYLASLYPPAMVAQYTVPLDTLFRGTALPLAAMNALFPAMAHAGVSSERTRRMVSGATWLIFFLWGAPIWLLSLILQPLLDLWLGSDFAGQVVQIAECLLLGILINGFAHIPYALLHSAGRADVTGKLHVLELPIYVGLLIVLVAVYGVVGAAYAWTARIAIDAALLYSITWVHFRSIRQQILTAGAIASFAALAFWMILVARA